jgi:outer membrane protein
MMKTTIRVIVLAVGALSAVPAFANLSVNVGAITVAPNDSSSTLNVVETVAGLPAGSTQVAVNNNTQLGFTIDYKINNNWTAELIAATPFSHDVNVKGSAIDGLDIGSTKHLPPTLVAQYHFDLGNSKFDPFVGVGLNYTKFFDASASDTLKTTLRTLNVTKAGDNVDLDLDDSFGLALQAGVNYKINDNWGAHFAVSKIDIDTEANVTVNGNSIQKVDVQIDPMVVMVGVRFSM